MIEYHRRRDEHREVRELYHAMFKIQPDNAWVRGNYAKYLMNDLGLYDEAIEYAVKALEIMNYGQARATLAYALYSKWADLVMNQGVVEEDAKEYLAQAYQLYPNVDLVMAYRGSRNNGGDLARALKSKGVSIDARVEDGSTALIIASNAGQTNAVRNLLLLGANINAKSKNGLTALLGAADEGHHEIVQILLENGADKTQKIAGFTPAQLAERRGDKTLALLIQNFNAK